MIAFLLSGYLWGAYLSVGESLDLVGTNKQRAGVDLQSASGGVNVGGQYQFRLDDSSAARFSMGTGDIDFFANASLKWVPVPDYKKQPAIGVLTGLTFSREKNQTISTLNLAPLLSKSFVIDDGTLNPYAGLNLGFSFGPSNTAPLWILAGTELTTREIPDSRVHLEIGSSIREAFSYIQIGYAYEFGR